MWDTLVAFMKYLINFGSYQLGSLLYHIQGQIPPYIATVWLMLLIIPTSPVYSTIIHTPHTYADIHTDIHTYTHKLVT